MLDFLADAVFKRSQRQRAREIRARDPLYATAAYPHVTYRLHTVALDARFDRRWRGCLLSVEADGLHLYPQTRKMDIHVHYPADALRWFGRPQKYQPDYNEIWLHFATGGGQWQRLEIRAWKYEMQRLVRALKQIAAPPLVTAYRRQRPYVHYGPCAAQPAEQDLYGAWTLQPPLTLYLTPIALAEMDGAQVRRVIPLERVQAVEVMPRLDGPAGVVRFNVVDGEAVEMHAYVLLDYPAFGMALVEAAKRSLEEPPVFYCKKKDEDEDG